jgi:hypothetical protein
MIMCLDGNKLFDFLCVKQATVDAFNIEVIEFIVKLQFNETRRKLIPTLRDEV